MATTLAPHLEIPDGSGRWSSLRIHPLDRAEIILVFLAFPLALLGELTGGVTAGALGWGLAFLIGVLALMIVPLPVAAVRTLAPWILFLGYAVLSIGWTTDVAEGLQVIAQFGAVGVAYVAGWRAAGADPEVIAKVRRLSIWLIPACLIVFFNAAVDGASTFGWIRGGNAARPMVMMLALLVLMGTVGRSRRYTLVVWGAAFAIAVASGGRMGVAVLGVILIFLPATRVGWKSRLAIVVASLAILGFLIQFESVQERLFVGQQEGELSDIVTLEGNFNTAGRAQNWPKILAICSSEPLLGHGIGSTGGITHEATAGRTQHPHNDYLRVFCDVGFAGSVFFWGFFVMIAIRGWKLFRNTEATGIESELGAVGLLAVVALLLFSTTDNIVVYTATFMAAAGVVWGISDRTLVGVEQRRQDRLAFGIDAMARRA